MRIDQLTFFRFLAALAIVILHFGLQTYPFTLSGPQTLFKVTNSLLAFFFMLSGFVLAVSNFKRSLIKKDFYWNRFIRIYPLYLFALILLVAVRFLTNDQMQDVTWMHVLTNLTLTQSILTSNALSLNYPGWSLSAEAIFYLLFPFIYQYFNRIQVRAVIWSCALFWAFSVAMSVVSIEFLKAPHHFTQYFAGFHLNAFVIGVGAGIVFMKNREWFNQQRNEIIFNFVVLGLAYLFLIMTNSLIVEYSNAGVLSPFFLLLILTFSLDRAPFKEALYRKPFVLLGEASYSIYILQYSVWILFYALAAQFGLDWLYNFYICTAGLILISISTYQLLEKPLMIRFKRPQKPRTI